MDFLHHEILILILDEMPGMRKVIKSVLRQLGYSQFLEAENGAEGLHYLENEQKIDLIVSDLYLPKVSGIDLLKKIRKSEKYHDLPFLLVTGDTKKDNIIEALKAGANHCIVKPFTAQTLKEKLMIIDQQCVGHRNLAETSQVNLNSKQSISK